MKKTYEKPEIEIIHFEPEETICMSGTGGTWGDT